MSVWLTLHIQNALPIEPEVDYIGMKKIVWC